MRCGSMTGGDLRSRHDHRPISRTARELTHYDHESQKAAARQLREAEAIHSIGLNDPDEMTGVSPADREKMAIDAHLRLRAICENRVLVAAAIDALIEALDSREPIELAHSRQFDALPARSGLAGLGVWRQIFLWMARSLVLDNFPDEEHDRVRALLDLGMEAIS
jgi:hypothetical protein